MTETVVHVATIEEWKSVLDVWFKQGYEWCAGRKEYHEDYFYSGSRGLWLTEDNMISMANTSMHDCIEYSEFMAQQKEDNNMETYYVTQEQLDFLNTMYEELYSLDELLNRHTEARNLFDDFSIPEGNAVLRYLGGDTSIEFKAKEQLYRLWRIDDNETKVYMWFNGTTPDWSHNEKDAFTAPLDEIKKWQTPAWLVEEVD